MPRDLNSYRDYANLLGWTCISDIYQPGSLRTVVQWRRGTEAVTVHFGSLNWPYLAFHHEPHGTEHRLEGAELAILDRLFANEPPHPNSRCDQPTPVELDDVPRERFAIDELAVGIQDPVTDALEALESFGLTANEVNHLYREYLADQQGAES